VWPLVFMQKMGLCRFGGKKGARRPGTSALRGPK